LLSQIRELDLARIDDWVEQLAKGTPDPVAATQDVGLVPSHSPEPCKPAPRRKYRETIVLGEKLISQGKVAAVTIAGRQGTRLASNGPNGDLPISPIKQETLFRLFAETIQTVTR